MKEKRREIINDSMQALHALAKLMPQLNAQCSPVEMLEIINSALGANLSWVSVESADGPRVVCAGDVTCHAFNVAFSCQHPVAAASARLAGDLLERAYWPGGIFPSAPRLCAAAKRRAV
ncbi:hypothetical protein M5T14_01630 [Enterobacter hormaechei]|nr:hypothetical protein [Enterobacter hormaechei]UVZ91292.1 hypothetical protein M5T14_01630 [Enterobacter hormaechei]